MIAVIKFKYKSFAEVQQQQQQKSGMSTGTKALLGVGTVAGGLVGARYGLFGANVQRRIGKGMMSMGMKNQGANAIATANLTQINKHLAATGAKTMDKAAGEAYIKRAQEGLVKNAEWKSSEAGKKAMEEGKKRAEAAAKARADANAKEIAGKTQAKFGAAPAATTTTTGS